MQGQDPPRSTNSSVPTNSIVQADSADRHSKLTPQPPFIAMWYRLLQHGLVKGQQKTKKQFACNNRLRARHQTIAPHTLDYRACFQYERGLQSYIHGFTIHTSNFVSAVIPHYINAPPTVLHSGTYEAVTQSLIATPAWLHSSTGVNDAKPCTIPPKNTFPPVTVSTAYIRLKRRSSTVR